MYSQLNLIMPLKSSSCLLILLFCININCSINFDKVINEFVVKVPGGYSEAISIAKQMGFILDHKMIGFDDLFVFKYKKRVDYVHKFFQHRLKRSTKVHFVEQQIVRKRVKRAPTAPTTPFLFTDPLYDKQWYLMRSQKNPEKVDMNVLEAWQLGYSGKGVVVSILDDGIDYRHPDLRENYDPKASYDINGGDSDPLPNFDVMDNRHGTRCAGEVAAKGNNSKCGVGVAFNSRIGAVRMLDGEVTDRVEAESLSLNQQHIDIYSGSWGPDDNGQKVEGPARFAKLAFETGVKSGRRGLGNIFIWASGNGGNKHDSCACDGYVSSIFTLSVSSVSEANRKPWYLESCASTLITTYSSGGINDRKIISTDLGNRCAEDHTGTSASAPLAAGIIALLLEANANLTWRDVQYLAVVTANPQPFLDGNFIVNGANRKVSNLYGFGLMDAGKLVRLGLLWQTLPSQHICKSKTKVVNRNLSGEFVEKVTLNMDECSGEKIVNYLEHVILYLDVEYQKRGDLQVYLISPMGTRSEILPLRNLDYHSGSATFDKWPLMSVQFWGERTIGKWTVELSNIKSDPSVMKGLFKSFSLEIYGTEMFPIRLRPPTKTEPDGWFQQFERFVVYDSDVDDTVKNAYPRDYLQISNNTSEIPTIKCHNQCFNNTCKGWGPQHCMSCNKYKTHDGLCVERCPHRTYLNTDSLTCEPCHYSCDTCTGNGRNSCSRCHVGDSFSGSSKQCQLYVRGCSADLSKKLRSNNTDNSTCVKCPNYCSICNSKTRQCSQCQPGFVLTLYNQCKLSCALGSYVDSNGKCRVCHVNCLTCVNGNPYECTACDQAAFMLPIIDNYKYGHCVSECQPSYFTNLTTRQCFRCHQDCKTCTGPFSNMCTDCIPPSEMAQTTRTCADPVLYNCKPEEFKSTNGTCEKCPANCQTCSNGQCTSCSRINRFLHNSSCVENCPTDHFSTSKDNICLPCKSFCDPCNKNGSLSECSTCFKNMSRCHNQCNKREFWDDSSKSCKSCHSLCASCNGGTSRDCIKCLSSDDVLSLNNCTRRCPMKERVLYKDNLKLCIPCHSSCNGLLCNSETGNCLKCPDGHRISVDGRCERLITCPMSTYYSVIDTSCKACNQSCRSCQDNYHCDSCRRDHCLNPSNGSCHRCCSLFSSNKNCFKCIAGQEFCATSDFQPSPLRIRMHLYYILAGISICIVVVSIFLFIAVPLCKKDIIELMKNRDGNQYSVLRNNGELSDHSESSCDDNLSDNEASSLAPAHGSYMLLSTITNDRSVSVANNDTYSHTTIANNDHSKCTVQTKNNVRL